MNDLASVNELVNGIYRDFRSHLNRINYPLVFEYFDLKSRGYKAEDRGHDLGHFAILYTPIPKIRPDLMLIGDNPSWFDRVDMTLALNIVREIEKGVPQKSSYLVHNHTFAAQLKTIFNCNLKREDLLRQCVGLNRFWVQTGSDGIKDFIKQPRAEEYRRLKRICEYGTQRMVAALEPRVVILLGANSQKAFSHAFRGEHPSIAIEHARHPGRGGVNQCTESISAIIDKHRL